MTPKRRQLCKSIVTNSHCALARKCLQDHRTKKYIIKGFGALLRKEIALLCSDDEGIPRNVTSLQWTNLLSFMKTKTPTLLSILQSCTKTKKPWLSQDAITGVITSILCKHWRSSVSLFQRMVSLVLYTGHTSKKAGFSIKSNTNFNGIHHFIGVPKTSESWHMPLPSTNPSNR